MPFTDPCDGSIAQLTDAARALYARQQLGDVAFKWLGFNVGRFGYNDTNPVKVVPINPSLTSLVDTVFPTLTLKDFDISEKPNPKAISMVCRLATTEANFGLGEIGIWAVINWSNSNPLEVNQNVLMAVSHVPLQSKNHRHTYVHRIVIQF